LGIGDWAQSPIPNPQSFIILENKLISNNDKKKLLLIYNIIK